MFFTRNAFFTRTGWPDTKQQGLCPDTGRAEDVLAAGHDPPEPSKPWQLKREARCARSTPAEPAKPVAGSETDRAEAGADKPRRFTQPTPISRTRPPAQR